MKEKALFSIAITIVLLQLFVYFPVSIWTQNQFNFSVQLVDGRLVFVYVTLAITFTSLFVSLITPKIFLKFLLPFMVLLSILIFVQQNILVWNYGILDGNNLDFTHTEYLGWIDFSVWFLALVFYFWKREYLIENAKLILAFSVIASTSLLLVSIFSYDFDVSKSSSSYTEKNKFTFSKNKNVLLFVLDGFQSGLFWEIINKQPEIKGAFDGFTYYPNTTSVFAKTYPSIPLLLTGKIYQKEQSITAFLDSKYEDSLLTALIDLDWDVGLYPYVKNTIPFKPTIMSNFLDKISLMDKVSEYLRALDLTLFRSVPHFAKKRVFNKGKFVIHDDMVSSFEKTDYFAQSQYKNTRLPKPNKHMGLNFLRNIKTSSSLTLEKPVFRFYHLMMPHTPFLLNRNLEYGRYDKTFESYQNYAYASISLMISYLKELKKIGAYENSAIMIAADHGGGDYSSNNYNPETGLFYSSAKYAKQKASAKPILLVKEFNASGVMNISRKQVSLVDIAPTLARFSGVKLENENGYAIDEIAEDQQRQRTYYYYRFTSWDSKYLQDFQVFNIDGDVYKDESWTKKGLLTAQVRQGQESLKPYVFNKINRFGTDIKEGSDYHNRFLTGSYFRLQHSNAISDNQKFSLSINLDKPLINRQIYKIELDMSSRVDGTNVVVEIDNKQLALIQLKSKTKKHEIYYQPQHLSHPKDLKLQIYVANIDSKAKLFISKMVIRDLKNVRLHKIGNGSVINLSDNIERYFAKGFADKRSWGRWTNKGTASLLFDTEDSFCHNGYIKLNAKNFANKQELVKPEVYINGEILKPLSLIEKGKNYQLLYDCSVYNIDQNNIVALNFKMNNKGNTEKASGNKKTEKSRIALVSIEFGKSTTGTIPTEKETN